MKLQEIIDVFSIKTENVNTTNGWGFGGYRATKNTFEDGSVLLRGKYYYRHVKPTKYIRLFVNNSSETVLTEMVDIMNFLTDKYKVCCKIQKSNTKHIDNVSKNTIKNKLHKTWRKTIKGTNKQQLSMEFK